MFQPLPANVFKGVNEIFSVSDNVVMKRTLPFEFWKWRVEIVSGDKSAAVFGDPGDICGVTGNVIAGEVTVHVIAGEVT